MPLRGALAFASGPSGQDQVEWSSSVATGSRSGPVTVRAAAGATATRAGGAVGVAARRLLTTAHVLAGRAGETYRIAVVRGRWLVIAGWLAVAAVIMFLVPSASGGGATCRSAATDGS